MKLKKITALAMAVVMVLALFAGCEKPMDAQTLAQKMDEAAKNQNAVSGTMSMVLDMTMGVTGMSLDLSLDADVGIKATMEPLAAYADMDMTMEVLGQSETLEMEMYMAEEEGKVVSYTYTAADESWIREESEEIPEIPVAETGMSEIPAEKMTLAEEQQTIGEKSCYVLTVNMDGELFQQYMDTAMEAMTAELDEETLAIVEGMDMSALSTTMVYYVDAESFLPVQLEAEILGFGEMMNGVLGEMFAEAMMGMGGEETEITFDIPAFTVAFTDISYDAVEVPTVPEEGVEAAALNPLQADGSYVLRLNEDAIRIVSPEGYSEYYVEGSAMGLITEDYMNYADYSLLTDITADDMAAAVEADALYAQEEELYDSHGAAEEVNGFTVMYVKYNDGTAYYYGWKQLNACMLLVTFYTSDLTLDHTPLFNAVEIYEG